MRILRIGTSGKAPGVAIAVFTSVVAMNLPGRLARAQSTISFQGFEAGDSWTISTGSGNVSTSTGSGDTPASQRILAGTHSWQISASTGTLELASQSVTGYTDVSLTYRATATSANASNGVDAADYLRSFLAFNGAAWPTNSAANADISLVGASNSRWGYNATLTATTTAGTNLQVASPQSGTSTNNYSTFVINVPNGKSTLALRFIVVDSSTNERWNIENITLTGTVPATASWDADGTGAGQGGTGTWDVTNRLFTNGDLIWNNSVNGSTTAVTFAGTAGTVTAGTGISVNAMSFTVSGYTLQSNTVTLTGTSPAISVPTSGHTATISSALAGANSLTKSGAGKLVLSGGANSYSGTTTITAGSLVVNGTHSGGGSYVVSSTGTLGGSGTITPANDSSVTINGTIAPGDASSAKLTLTTSGTGSTVFAPGGVYEWGMTNATAAAGVGWDQVALQSLLVSATSGSKFTIRVVGTNPSNFSAIPPGPGFYSWIIATTTGITGFDAASFDIDPSGFSPIATGGHFILAQNGNNLELYYVPEPSVGLPVLACAALVRRRRHAVRACSNSASSFRRSSYATQVAFLVRSAR